MAVSGSRKIYEFLEKTSPLKSDGQPGKEPRFWNNSDEKGPKQEKLIQPAHDTERHGSRNPPL